jgi:hypothetical protein
MAAPAVASPEIRSIFIISSLTWKTLLLQNLVPKTLLFNPDRAARCSPERRGKSHYRMNAWLAFDP